MTILYGQSLNEWTLAESDQSMRS